MQKRKGRRTPKRSGQEPPKGSRFPSEILASNIRAYRRLADLTQGELGDRMTAQLGHEWSEQTCGFVERGDRTVSTDELVGLALALGVTIADLLDPVGPTDSRTEGMYVGHVGYGGAPYLPSEIARVLARSAGPVKLERGSITVPVSDSTLPYVMPDLSGDESHTKED